MRVLLISSFPPSVHNIGVPSALPYYLSQNKPQDVDLDLLYFEGFEEKKVFFEPYFKDVFSKVVKVKLTPKLIYFPLRIIQKVRFLNLLSGVSLHHLPTLKSLLLIKKNNYDLIWIYPSNLFLWSLFLGKKKIVMTGPDCTVLVHNLISDYYKINIQKVNKKLVIDNKLRLKENLILEKNWLNSKCLIHVVGEEDRKQYNMIQNSENVFFSPHPYYEFNTIKKTIDEVEGKLTILVSGENQSIYIGSFWDEITEVLVENKKLSEHYKFIIIGKNFQKSVNKLTNASYEVEYFQWVESYENILSNAQIQIFPIVLGTGTKGKVLCALASGLYCIGTSFALENIEIDKNYNLKQIDLHDSDKIVSILFDILSDKSKYSLCALKHSEEVLNKHSPSRTGKLFWNRIVKFSREKQ